MEYDINDTSVGLEREHAALSWLRANDPVHWDVKNEAWLITRNADVREVLHHSRIWSSAHGYFTPSHMSEAKSSILTLDDPEHGRHRKLIARAFTPRMLQHQAARARALMDDAIDAIADRRACDLVESLAIPLPMKIIAGMVSFDEADSEEFRTLSDALFEFTSATPTEPEIFQRGIDAFSSLADHVRSAVAQRRREPRSDLLSVLVKGVDDGDDGE